MSARKPTKIICIQTQFRKRRDVTDMFEKAEIEIYELDLEVGTDLITVSPGSDPDANFGTEDM